MHVCVGEKDVAINRVSESERGEIDLILSVTFNNAWENEDLGRRLIREKKEKEVRERETYDVNFYI